MSAETAVEKKMNADKPQSTYALLYELEGVAIHARRAEFEALKNILADCKVNFAPPVFARYCLNRAPEAYLPALIEALGIKKANEKEWAQDIRNGIGLYMASAEATLKPLVQQLVQLAVDRHMQVALLTHMKEAMVGSLLKQWAAPHDQAIVFVVDAGQHLSPRADAWLRLAKTLSRTPRQCVAVTGSHYSTRTALSCGMRCLVVPDEFSAFQDFGGADAVLDSEADALDDLPALLDSVAPQKPFI